MTDKFERAVAVVFVHEGGYINNPRDPGGETKWGITKRWHPTVDIKKLTREEARNIYYTEYWEPNGFEFLPEMMATKVFDIGVNIGCNRALHILARAASENNIGIAELNEENSSLILAMFQKLVEEYYRSLEHPAFLKGWLRRLYS